jgi:hypothetical protein
MGNEYGSERAGLELSPGGACLRSLAFTTRHEFPDLAHRAGGEIVRSMHLQVSGNGGIEGFADDSTVRVPLRCSTSVREP